MEKIMNKANEIDPLHIKIVPKGILTTYIVKRSLSCVFCFILAVVMIIPLTIWPGLILLIAPAEISVLGKIHDEAQLIQWVRHHTIVREGRWDKTEEEKDLAYSKAPERRDSTVGYIR
jgi:hypothetical protein